MKASWGHLLWKSFFVFCELKNDLNPQNLVVKKSAEIFESGHLKIYTSNEKKLELSFEKWVIRKFLI